MSINFKNFFKRFLIFSFSFLFIFSKLTKVNKNIKDFQKRIKFIAKSSQFSEEQIILLESKSKNIFFILFSFYSFMSFLALMNINLGKQLTGIMTFIMAFIYCNPVTTIKKNFEKNNYQYDWKIYIPSLEFCIISCLGFAMLLSSCHFNEEEDKDKYVNINKDVTEIKKGTKEKEN